MFTIDVEEEDEIFIQCIVDNNVVNDALDDQRPSAEESKSKGFQWKPTQTKRETVGATFGTS